MTDRTLERYLLGDLSPEESDRIAERYFLDREFREGHLLAVEGLLIRRYLWRKLDARDRQLFEEKYLQIPALKEKVEEVQRLQTAFSGSSPSWIPAKTKRASLWTVLAPSTALAIIGVATLATTWSMLRSREVVPQNVIVSAPQTASPGDVPKGSVSAPTVVVLPLLPGATQGKGACSSIQRLFLTGQEQEVRLNLDLAGDRESRLYVKLEQIKERSRALTYSWDQVRSVSTDSGQTLLISIKAGRLPAGDFIVTVKHRASDSDEDAIESYNFSVVRGQ